MGEEMISVPKEPTREQIDRAVALMLNWQLSSKNVGWTEYARQIYKTMIDPHTIKQTPAH